MADPFDLSGKIALVTGAARGLGRAASEGLSRAGATIAAVDRLDDETATLVHAIEAAGGRATAHHVDLRSVASIEAMVDEVVARHGRIDILLNNAGTKVAQDVLEVTEDAWDLVMDVNLKGAFFCAQAVARTMVRQGGGRIINMASTYAVVGARGRATYAISKGGVLQFTKVMAIELASRGVNVNAIGPTSTNTPMNESFFAQEEWREKALARIPAGRFCEPDDIIGAVIFLASPASAMVHGHLLLVDGAFTAI